MIERLVIGNLRRAQAFDASLRTTNALDRIADDLADSILFERNGSRRIANIDKLVSRYIEESENSILPQAQRVGTQNARDILSKTPKPIDLADAAEREAALFRSRSRAQARLDIIRRSVRANGSQLDASLSRYWLEPSEGTSAKAKLQRLRRIHTGMERKRAEYETKLRQFHEGKIKSRPAKPNLDYLSRMVEESKKDIRAQARRAGTDAEIATMQARGHKRFVWVTPNGASACPDCRNRQSVVLTIAEWESVGRPGSGKTVCDVNCFCMLLPVESVSSAPSLITGAHTTTAGPLTDPGILAFLNRHRMAKKSA
jgi:hypothetical protein